MRSCASDSQISHGSRPGYFSGTASSSTSAPSTSAISPTADDRPPAPQSVIAVHRCSAPSSTSISSFSVTGSPIWTLAPATSPVVASISALENVAPRMPSRPGARRRARRPGRRGTVPVRAPTIPGTAGPGGRRCRCSRRTRAGWRCSRGRRAPRRRPWAGRSCCRSRRRRRRRPGGSAAGAACRRGRRPATVSAGPKQRMSVTAIGRCPIPMTSRMTPPTPVFAPPNGSTADGWLCVSAFSARDTPSTNETMPALPTNDEQDELGADLVGGVAELAEQRE